MLSFVSHTLAYVLLLFPILGVAHQSSTSYLDINLNATNASHSYTAQLHLGLLDLEMAVGIDDDHNGQITWAEVLANRQNITSAVNQSLLFRQGDESCLLFSNSPKIDLLSNGVYTALDLIIDCPSAGELSLKYGFFFEQNSDHRGIISAAFNDVEQVFVASPADNSINLPLTQQQSVPFTKLIIEGIWHIWIGIDHILFLIALLLPSVVYRQSGKWFAQTKFTPVFHDVLRIVTAFTIAHSITLMAASMGWIVLPSALVETLIAASVVFAAILILFPFKHNKRWTLAFLFGLIHGFGFASVLSDLNMSQGNFWRTALGFNIGVEIGQLVIVATLLPVLYIIRRQSLYVSTVLPSSAVVMAVIGVFWVYERLI